MNKLMIPALAVSAVTLLSGCQHVSVRHHHPQPVEVVEEHRTVYVEHRDVEVHEHRHERRSPQRVVVTPAPPVRVVVTGERHEEHRHGHRPPVRVVTPAPRQEGRRHEHRTPVRVVAPAPRHDEHTRRIEIINLPKHKTTPARRDEERGHRGPEHNRPTKVVVPPVQRHEVRDRHQHQDNRRPVRVVEPAQRHDVNKRSQRDKDRDSRWQEYRTKESHRQENTRLLVKTSHPTPKVIEARQHPANASKHSKPEKPSAKPHKQDKYAEKERHDKRYEHRRGE